MSTTIRPARLGDAFEMARVHVGAWRAAYPDLMPQDYLDGLDVAQRAEWWRRGLGRSRERDPILVAELDGQLVAFAALGPASDDAQPGVGELYAINVAPEVWGRGVGDALLRQVHTELVRLGYDTAVLWVVPGNQRAHGFYERRGWHDDGVGRTATVLGVSVSEVRYRIGLSPVP